MVTALGDFDPTVGGHLVLWDLKLGIEFPPGSTILLPSAIFRHSNLPIGKGQVRYSLTQYSAGGLFRWAACGFRPHKQFAMDGGVYGETGEARWVKGLNMFSTIAELRARVQPDVS